MLTAACLYRQKGESLILQHLTLSFPVRTAMAHRQSQPPSENSTAKVELKGSRQCQNAYDHPLLPQYQRIADFADVLSTSHVQLTNDSLETDQ